MTGLAPTSSSFHCQWTYDVFINFRGEDTRHGFTGYLNDALKNAGVRTFIDDEELGKGNEIKPSLLEAIENSRMAITIFSKSYASSTFCLDELVKIHQCVKGKNQMVLPIFYDVEPAEVRRQKGPYEQALVMHTDEEKTRNWRLALHEIANISGFHYDSRHEYEYEFIGKILKEISHKIKRVPLFVAEHPVGLDSRVSKVNSLLQIGLDNNVNMVGICGIGGLGKTTIAKAVYNSIAYGFEGACFLNDIKENSMKLGLQGLQETMLLEILGEEKIKIRNSDRGVEEIKMRLKQKKLLLILDDVDKDEQLQKLAGHCNWFGDGSRIIIVTRDRHLLQKHGVERIYDMELFNDEESLELLRWNAFKGNQVDSSYNEVMSSAISYAQGLPLALTIIGCELFGMEINEWESLLENYKGSPNANIQEILKKSYDGLNDFGKEIFLDIACYFNGKNIENVKNMVKRVHDFDPSHGIKVLVNKCLLRIEGGNIYMHDLIRDMGRKIVHQESPEAGKRSRLWLHEDIVHVLEDNTGTNEVNIIIQDNSLKCMEVDWDGEAFKSMKNLKVLIFNNVKCSKSPKYLPNSLKVLEWQGYPSSSLPADFRPKKLVEFNIGFSNLSSVEIVKNSNNLSVLNLRGCQYITVIPDLSNHRNMKELVLEDCKNLVEIHDSIGDLAKLKFLNADGCVRLKTFPRHLKLPSLERITLENCSSLKYFPEILEEMEVMEHLDLEGTGIEKLPWSICKITQLERLHIGMHKGIEIPESISLLPKLEYMSVSGGENLLSYNHEEAQEQELWSKKCPNMTTFEYRYSNISNDLLRINLARFFNVQRLDLSGSNFTVLPACIKECHRLREILLNDCKYLREVEGIPPKIAYLGATNCISLSLESRRLLLSQELLTAPHKNYAIFKFVVPGTSIPRWFDIRSKGETISFWFRNCMPRLYVCALVRKPNDHTVVRIEETGWICTDSFEIGSERSDADHIVVQRYDINYHQRTHPFRKDCWNGHVHISLEFNHEDPKGVEEFGVYLMKPLCETKDVRSTDPYEISDSTSGDQATMDLLSTFSMLPMIECSHDTFRNQGQSTEDNNWPSLLPCGETPFYNGSTSHQGYGIMEIMDNAKDINSRHMDSDAAMDLLSTFPMLPLVEFSHDTFRNQGQNFEENKWLSLRPCWETPLSEGSTSQQENHKEVCNVYNLEDHSTPIHQHVESCDYGFICSERQQQQNMTLINGDEISGGSEDDRKAKGKEIVVYNDSINEK